jgi:motility quorum-sensing regulator/GCU-specific mRNA interferase toxin
LTRGKTNTALQARCRQVIGGGGQDTRDRGCGSGGAALGFDVAGIVGVVKTLTMADFYKSMTTYADHRIWQDVYRPVTPMGDVYLKLTVIDDVLIVSFKEL